MLPTSRLSPRMSVNSSEKSNPKNCLIFEFNSGIIRLWPTVESSSTTRSANCPICDFFPALGGSCERNRACSRERIPLRVRQGSKRPAPFETPRDNQGLPRQSLLCRCITLLGCFLDFLDRVAERLARFSDLMLKISLTGCLSVDSLRIGLFYHK